MRISVSQRFGLGFLLVILLMVLVMVITTGSVNLYRANSLRLATHVLPEATTADHLAANVNTMISATLRYVLTGNPLDRQAHATAVAETNRLLAALREGVVQDEDRSEAETHGLDQLDAAVKSVQTRTEGFVRARQEDRSLPIGRVLSQLDAEQVRFTIALATLTSSFEIQRAASVQAAEANPLTIPWALSGVILIVCVGWFLMLLRTVVQPLRTLHDATLTVAGGDLQRQVPVAGDHEIGDLARAFNQMVQVVGKQQADLQQQITLANAARQEAEAARQTVVEQLSQIEAQRSMISEMSVPVLPVGEGTLVMPLIGALDSNRMQLAQAQALHSLEQAHATHLVIDITGVPIVDTMVAQGLVRMVQASRLLGTTTMLVGVRPEVAQTIVGLGLQLHEIITMASLQEAIIYARRSGAHV
jgi:rsbT co-antagonist protein RsbR